MFPLKNHIHNTMQFFIKNKTTQHHQELPHTVHLHIYCKLFPQQIEHELEMWANAQCDGRPAEYKWCLLFNTAKFG